MKKLGLLLGFFLALPALADTGYTRYPVQGSVITTGNLTSGTTGLTVTSGTNAVIGTGTSLSIQNATTSQPGLLTAADWNTFSGKQSALTLGNITGSAPISVSGGTGAIIGSGVSLSLTSPLSATYLPNPTASTLGGVESLAATSHQWINTISTSGVPSSTQPAFTDISGTLGLGAGGTNATSAAAAFNNLSPMTTLGDVEYESGAATASRLAGNTTSTTKYLTQTGTGTVSAAPSWTQPACANLSNAAASCSTDATNASNISSGTLGAARLPAPTASTLGGVESLVSTAHQWINTISTAGVPSSTQPAFADISGTATAAQVPPAFSARNFLINADGSLWQRGTSTTLANAAGAYQGDRFYAWNSLGAVGVLTYAQASPTLAQSVFGFSVKSSTAPTTAVNFGINWGQSLDNPTSMKLYNQPASLSMQVRALGNVTQVTIAIGYVTSEAKFGITSGLPTTIISSQTVTVNSSTFSLGSLTNVSMGTSVTTSGSYFVVCYASGVSSGHVSDLNNGFVVEQPELNLGATAASFSTAGANAGDEVAMAQRFYQKSFPLATAPTNAGGDNYRFVATDYATNSGFGSIPFQTRMRAAPTVTAYNTNSGTAGAFSAFASGSWVDTTPSTVTVTDSFWSFTLGITGSATNAFMVRGAWTADAEI